MRLSGSFAVFTVLFILVCATEFWETKSLARLSDYDTTRGNVNGNIFHLEIYYWVFTSHRFFSPITCNASLRLLLQSLLPSSLLLRLDVHMNILLTGAGGSSKQEVQ